MVRSTPWINGVYGTPVLSNNGRTATWSVAVVAPSRPGTYAMYAYGRDNPFGKTCTGDSYNFAASSQTVLSVGEDGTTSTTIALSTSTTTSTSLVLRMPAITTIVPTGSTSTTSTPQSTSTPPRSTSTTSPTATTVNDGATSTSSVLQSLAPTTTTTKPPVVVDVTREASIPVPAGTATVVIPETSISELLDRVPESFRNGAVVRVRADDSSWTYVAATEIKDLSLAVGARTASIQIEVFVDGLDTITYTVDLERPSSSSRDRLLGFGLLVFATCIGVLFLMLASRRRRQNQDPPFPPLPGKSA